MIGTLLVFKVSARHPEETTLKSGGQSVETLQALQKAVGGYIEIDIATAVAKF